MVINCNLDHSLRACAWLLSGMLAVSLLTPRAALGQTAEAAEAAPAEVMDESDVHGEPPASETAPPADTPPPATPPQDGTPHKTEFKATLDSQQPNKSPWLTLEHHVGAMLDVGVPDGVALSAVYQPVFWGNVHLGLTTNVLAVGMRGGVTFTPVDFLITPTLTFDIGHYFGSDISDTISDIVGDEVDPEFFSEVAYTYYNFHLGFSLGGEFFQFFMRGGMTRMNVSFSGGTVELDDDSSLEATEGADVDVWTPSLKLGCLIYFL